MLHTNIRSLSSHLDELVVLFCQTNKLIDVIGVSETWSSTQKECLTNTDIEGYNFYKTKSLSQNGGIGLYVKKSFISNSWENLNFGCNEFETVWVKVENTNDKNYLFCCEYRHPNLDVDVFTSHLQLILPKLTNKQVFIMGDFNINLLYCDGHAPTNDFINNLFSYNFLPCTNHPKRISEHSSTIIDNIFISLVNANVISGNILTQISII